MKFASVLTVLLCAASHQAIAGFEWVAPDSNPTAQSYSIPAIPTAEPRDVIRAIRTDQSFAQPISAPAPVLDNVVITAPIAPSIDPYAPIAAQPTLAPLPEPVSAPAYEPTTLPAPIFPRYTAITPNVPNAAPPVTPHFSAEPTTIAAQQEVWADAASSFEPVAGFGDELPLALALRDIIPADYTYRFARGVNPGVAVSWDAQGRPWDLVVAELLAPHNLGVVLQGHQVIIRPSNAFSIPSISVATPPPAVVPASSHQAYKAPPATNAPFSQFQHGPIDLLPAPDAP